MIPKKYVPNFLKPIIRQARFWLKPNWGMIQMINERDDLIEQYKAVIKNTKNIKKNINSKKILFVSGYGIGTSYITIEPIIMLSLIARGHSVENVYCDNALSSCEFNPVGNNYPKAESEYLQGITSRAINEKCNFCKGNVEAINNLLKIPLHSLTTFLDSDNYDTSLNYISNFYQREKKYTSYCYDDINIGEDAYASILRVTYRGEIPDGELGESLKKRYLISSIQSVIAYKKLFSMIKPDRIVCIHGIYQTHGLVVKVAKKLGIPVIVIGGGGIRKDTVLACHGETYHHQLINEDNSIWLKNQFNNVIESKVIDYANKKRHSGSSVDYLNYHPNPQNNVEMICNELNIDRDRPIVSIYTNVIWDAQILYKSNAFENIYDWVRTTIELLENQDIWLLVRVHPAEVKGGNPSNQKMEDELKKIFPILPRNVRIVPPESDISSYMLAEMSILNIIYGTKMGLEIALMKKPVMVCGESFSRNKGYCIDIDNKNEYSEYLKDILNKNFEHDIQSNYELAVRYAYYLYFQKMIDMPFSSDNQMDAGSGKKLNFSGLDDLLDKEKMGGLNSLCNGIINLEPLHHDQLY